MSASRRAGPARPWEVVSLSSQPGVLPLRPHTVGELLDAAVALLRTRARLLITLGVVAAAAEQVLLFPLRRLADLDLRYLPPDDRWRWWALLVVVGFAAEAGIIALLGGPAAGAVPRALLGRAAPVSAGGARPVLVTVVVAAIVTSLCGLAVATMFGWPVTYFLLVPLTIGLWLWLYGSVGLAVPAAVIERRGPLAAVWRSISLSQRGVMRTVRIRLLGYGSWLLIRLAWGQGALLVIMLIYTPSSTTMDNVLMAAVYFVVNALAYPVLACLDAVLQLEARIRTEGLDLGLRRVLARGVDASDTLAGR